MQFEGELRLAAMREGQRQSEGPGVHPKPVMGPELRAAQRKMGDGPDRELTVRLPDADRCLVVAREPGWCC